AYAAIINESDTNDDDLLQKAQALYLENNPKKTPFAFLHCWLEKDAGCEDTLQAKKSIAESQRRRADLLEMQTHLALFSANTEDMDEDCTMFFQISRRAVLDKLQKNMN
ncbi:unnamed protein product, partial [Aphanomyces euteiches]